MYKIYFLIKIGLPPIGLGIFPIKLSEFVISHSVGSYDKKKLLKIDEISANTFFKFM